MMKMTVKGGAAVDPDSGKCRYSSSCQQYSVCLNSQIVVYHVTGDIHLMGWSDNLGLINYDASL